MDTKEKFDEMVAFDFSNLHLKQSGNDNCFGCDSCDSCDRDICNCNSVVL